MFENLTQKLEVVFRNLRGLGKITPENIELPLREVRRALLDADVNYKVVKQFMEQVQKKAIGQDVLYSITPGQLIIKIIYDEMVALLGSSKADILIASEPPTIVMIAGLQGSGKTTFAAKLAKYLKDKGRLPLLVGADTHRPAALEQLQKLGAQAGVPVFIDQGKDAVSVSSESIQYARKNVRDTVIIDTAGRLHIDEEMMEEASSISKATKPHEILFVVDAMTGQDAVNVAKAFNEKLNLTGIVLAKLDGDSRGGAALSVRTIVQKPIKFVSVGEKLDALEPFYPDRMASRILGMGDVITLVEKAQQQYDQTKAIKLEEKLRKHQFTLEDFLEQLQEIRKMGPLSQIIEMLPGINRLSVDADVSEKSFKRAEAIIQSMTKEERMRPSIINGSRRRRIANGSGTTIQEVNSLLKQFEEMQKMMKRFGKRNMKDAMKKFNFPID